jgi:hypothetical protein
MNADPDPATQINADPDPKRWLVLDTEEGRVDTETYKS